MIPGDPGDFWSWTAGAATAAPANLEDKLVRRGAEFSIRYPSSRSRNKTRKYYRLGYALAFYLFGIWGYEKAN